MPARFIIADVFDGLATLETGSVDVVITSPPFLALRSYLPADHELKGKEIGSEATPAEFIDTLLKVTAELRRVLAPHGSICVELGDTYSGNFPATGTNWGDDPKSPGKTTPPTVDRSVEGWPLSKSRTLIPSLYQIALAYGFNPLTGQSSPAGQWRIRNIITWARPNPPVGALGDKWRPATSDLVIACTSSKRYWDDLATRRPSINPIGIGVRPTQARVNGNDINDHRDQLGPFTAEMQASGAPLLDYWVIPLLEGEEPTRYGPKDKPQSGAALLVHSKMRTDPEYAGRASGVNAKPYTDGPGAPLLDYWVIPPGGYTGSHYAVFPEELVVPCVQAMCPPKVCLTCGEPSRRIVEKTPEYAVWRASRSLENIDPTDQQIARNESYGVTTSIDHRDDGGARGELYQTTGWSDCGHDTWRPGLVLDPFAGSGTTLAVATGHGHDAIGIDIDSRNAELARDRVGPFLFEMVDISVPTP